MPDGNDPKEPAPAITDGQLAQEALAHLWEAMADLDELGEVELLDQTTTVHETLCGRIADYNRYVISAARQAKADQIAAAAGLQE